MEFSALIDKLTPDIYQRLKKAVETGKWPDGRRLTAEQRESSLQAVIAYEHRHNLPENQRTGAMDTQGSDCHINSNDESPLKWQ